ncbi:MAG TPA: bifunctional metallophosphatase/5'-nucleotidase [Polyangiales bacterium]|nr:bifunctional metallophosphatase/5'-nucleotidase [Polyangiales bacterium]
MLGRDVSLKALLLLTALAAGCSDDDDAPEQELGDASSPATGEDARAPERDGGAPDARTSELDASTGGDIDGGVSPVDAALALDGGITDAQADAGSKLVEIQVLAFNDFHGNIEPPTGSSGNVVLAQGDGGTVIAGGAAYFARHIATLRAQNPNTVVVSAGDLIGASPLASALFHDEPTVEAMNELGLDFNGVGNHEFDEGRSEILRMQSGGCHPSDGCQAGHTFTGAEFQFLAANVNEQSGMSLFPRYGVKTFDGVQVAFIGMTLEGTPSIVTPSGIEGLSFLDEANTVNSLIPELKSKGIQAIVVVIHEGGYQTGFINDCQGISGAIVDIAQRLDPAVDLIVSGHTHAAYNCEIAGKRVTSALSFGRLVTQIALSVDATTKDVVKVTAVNRPATRDVPVVPEVETLVNDYVSRAAPLRDRRIGEASEPLTRTTTTGESTLGDVIADSQRAATFDEANPLPQVALMNPGGIRADLEAGPITYGEAFTIQPFGNSLVAMTLTGAQLKTALEQQWTATSSRILSPSSGLTYSYSTSAALGSRVSALAVDGVAVDPAARYRVTVNSFLATGGDGFLVFNEGTERVGGDVDIDALEKYLTANDPIDAPELNRITKLD